MLELRRQTAALQIVLSDSPPLARKHSNRWDCLLAACIANVFVQEGLRLPGWVEARGSSLDSEWSPLGQRPNADLRKGTPLELRERGILLTWKQLLWLGSMEAPLQNRNPAS
ncbi:hypothetical protein GCM10027052_10550 [Parafrigoribacterium mesophilum]